MYNQERQRGMRAEVSRGWRHCIFTSTWCSLCGDSFGGKSAMLEKRMHLICMTLTLLPGRISSSVDIYVSALFPSLRHACPDDGVVLPGDPAALGPVPGLQYADDNFMAYSAPDFGRPACHAFCIVYIALCIKIHQCGRIYMWKYAT